MWQARTGTWTGRHRSDPLCGITITWPDDGKTRLERMRRLLKPSSLDRRRVERPYGRAPRRICFSRTTRAYVAQKFFVLPGSVASADGTDFAPLRAMANNRCVYARERNQMTNRFRTPRRAAATLGMMVIAAALAERPALAQQATTGLVQNEGLIWGSFGFQFDVGGSVNSSGIGVVGGDRAEINANTWSERYDAALVFRVGGGYNLTETGQVFGAFHWEQSESDQTAVGLIDGQPLEASFGDYQAWGIDAGYRHFFPTTVALKPFASGSFGFQHVQEISASLSSATGFVAADVPFYDDSWVTQWRVGTGFLWDLTERFGWLVTLDVKYSGVLADRAGLGTLGFERVNDTGNRWTMPLMVGGYVKF